MLIGIHLGCYGKEHDGKLTLFDAVEAALSVEGLQRLRLGSLESVEVEARLLNLMEKDKRLCRQLHLPLQAGCDTTLARMHRPYDTRRFTELLADIRKRIPDIAITTDIIAGFPGETEEEFASTLVFAENCGFSKMHISLIPNGRELRPKKCPIKFLKLLSKDVVHNLLSLIISSSRNF